MRTILAPVPDCGFTSRLFNDGCTCSLLSVLVLVDDSAGEAMIKSRTQKEISLIPILVSPMIICRVMASNKGSRVKRLYFVGFNRKYVEQISLVRISARTFRVRNMISYLC